MPATYVTSEGDMLDLVAWRHYGYSSGAVEAILEANRGLGDEPPVLPAGLVITLPDLTQAAAQAPALVRLWD